MMAGLLCWAALILGLLQLSAVASQETGLSGAATRALLSVPPYVRGPDYQYMLEERFRENGVSYMGSAERLRIAVEKLHKGQSLIITTIGGSITAGQGCVDAPSWSQYLLNWVNDTYPGLGMVHMGAVGGTLSTYMSVCHNLHVHRESDIIFMEYSVNDLQSPMPHFQNDLRKGFERLVRKLLNYPNRPAVVLVHAYQWFKQIPFYGTFWGNAERELGEFALYYTLPQLSVKACCYHLMKENKPGFQVDKFRVGPEEQALKNLAFYYDQIHPDGNTGARVIAELAMHLLSKALDSVKARPVTQAERDIAAGELPYPMIPENFQSLNDRCFIGQHFTDTVTGKDGWEWVNESKTDRPKWGFISSTPGSTLRLKLDTTATSKGEADKSSEVLVEFAYLRSYENMGAASIKCEGECTCQETKMEGHTVERNSQLHLHNFYASQSKECIVVITVLPETLSGGHKVKVAGVMVSEEAGNMAGIQNNMAVEYVHDISMRGAGTFDVRNHARR